MRFSRSGEHSPINIGNPVEFAVLECARAILEAANSTSQQRFEPLPQDDPTRLCPEITKERLRIACEPRTRIGAGLVKFLDFFKSELAVYV